MMQLVAGTQVWLACRPTDMRKGFNGLAAQVKNVLLADPFCGHVFVFRGKRGDCLKALHWDGIGLCLFAKRLEHGRFMWPPVMDESYQLSSAQLALLAWTGVGPLLRRCHSARQSCKNLKKHWR